MKRLLLVGVLAVAASLFAVAPALGESAQGGDICACYDPPPPPPPPPPDLSAELWTGGFAEDSFTLIYFGGLRCKTQNFTQQFTQAGLFNVLTYKGMFRVCYRHGNGISSVSDVHGDVTWTRAPWSWQGNDNGYPYHVRYAKRVDFFYKGTAAICLFNYGCGPSKHPWVTLTFYDNNTMTRRVGVS